MVPLKKGSDFLNAKEWHNQLRMLYRMVCQLSIPIDVFCATAFLARADLASKGLCFLEHLVAPRDIQKSLILSLITHSSIYHDDYEGTTVDWHLAMSSVAELLRGTPSDVNTEQILLLRRAKCFYRTENHMYLLQEMLAETNLDQAGEAPVARLILITYLFDCDLTFLPRADICKACIFVSHYLVRFFRLPAEVEIGKYVFEDGIRKWVRDIAARVCFNFLEDPPHCRQRFSINVTKQELSIKEMTIL